MPSIVKEEATVKSRELALAKAKVVLLCSTPETS